jgi:hypothetical protein
MSSLGLIDSLGVTYTLYDTAVGLGVRDQAGPNHRGSRRGMRHKFESQPKFGIVGIRCPVHAVYPV